MSKTLKAINEITPGSSLPTADLVYRVYVAALDEGGYPTVVAECDRIDSEFTDWSSFQLANRLRNAYDTDQQTRNP